MAIIANIPINNIVNRLNTGCCAESDNDCPICFHDMLFPKQVSCCKRRFHEDCLNKWYSKSPTCPNCRAPKDKAQNVIQPNSILQSFYNFYNNEFRNTVLPKTVGIDREIDEICRKYSYMIRVEFIQRHQGRMINELAKLYKNRNAQRFNEEIKHYIDNPVPKKRGRPLGSKNKPKNPLEIMVKKESRQEKEKKERENRIVNMIKEYNIIGKRKQQQEELNQAIAKKNEADRIAKEELAKKNEADRIAKEELAKKKEAEHIAKEELAKKKEAERIAKEELKLNPVKMAGNAALKRAIIGILDKGGYGK